MGGEDEQIARQVRAARAEIIEAVNFTSARHGLNPAEIETALSGALAMAIASHAKPGAERCTVLAAIVKHLRQVLPGRDRRGGASAISRGRHADLRAGFYEGDNS